MPARRSKSIDPLAAFHDAVREWFTSSFEGPTRAQQLGWPAIASGESTLILAPTGSGKTLTAFLWCINELMFSPIPDKKERCRALYISPLKALAVDVERNLRAPIYGIARVAAARGDEFHAPSISIRTGDTPQRERAQFLRTPTDILITTPESLYLLLTSQSREVLRSVESVIIDEIHALVPTKRGSHLALSLERLEQICDKPPQRIGLSATQRPLDEVARYLGGARPRTITLAASESTLEPDTEFQHADGDRPEYRQVTIVDTGERKKLSLRVEVPLEDMAELGQPIEIPSGPAAQGPVRTSIWPAIHPRLLELIRAHRSTLIFVNSRRLAERLAAALNDLAGEVLVSAHHGSLAREQRLEIEDQLKSGKLPALIATSSLELGIDMGAIDLVVQIEAPPSVASGMQRIGRAGHQVGAASGGVIFPKHRSDLVACAAISEAMLRGEIEPIRYPRNPLDVLAQQIVAMASTDAWNVDELFAAIRSAAPFAELSRTIFEGVLDMLSGVYPSDDFAELRPRVTWDRTRNVVTAREGAKRVAIINGGTIPDRGLYGVFLAGAEKGARVGELDEEMVFESRVGEVFILGASSWRIEDITHDRVIVTPAPGEPGKMPFWHGDQADRPVEFGEKIGAMIRQIRGGVSRERVIDQLTNDRVLDPLAARNLVQYVDEQIDATETVPDDKTILVERCRDELGAWRVCLLSFFGGKIHAPWAMAAVTKARNELGVDAEVMWSDDGFVLRFPDTDEPPDTDVLIPSADEIEQLVVSQLSGTSLFAAKFRENAARALLLPKRRPGQRAPLWQQRKRAADLLAVAATYGSFPILLETYRECLRDVFDMPALLALLRQIEQRRIRVVTATTDTPSPFAASVLFRYVANYIYDGDAPLAERRAQVLSIDQTQLRELLGDVDFRDILDADAIAATEAELQHLDERYRARSADAIHDMLLHIGDLSRDEVLARANYDAATDIDQLVAARRVIEISIGGERRIAAAEDAARYRDALGTPLPIGLPDRFLAPVADAMHDLLARYARTHAPFALDDVVERWRIGRQLIEAKLHLLVERGKVLEGEFTPGEVRREWCDSDVLRTIRRKTLARLRHEIDPVEPHAYARFLTEWHGITSRRVGLNALLDAIEVLQGYPIPASLLDSEIFRARVDRYRESDLDTLASAGELVWVGVEPLGEHDGRIALFLTDSLPFLRRSPDDVELNGTEEAIVDYLRAHGATFFATLHAAIGGFPNEIVDALWSLVWKGVVTNDTFQALRSYTRAASARRRTSSRFRSRRTVPPGTEGRWGLVEQLIAAKPNETERAAAAARQLLQRYGVVSREVAVAEGLPGGFSSAYTILKAMEESGKLRRGYFVSGLSATQFALPGVVDRVRARRPDEVQTRVVLAATDPANPYGVLLDWPESSKQLARFVGAHVILVDGRLACYITRGWKQYVVFLPDDEPLRSTVGRAVAETLAEMVKSGRRRALLVAEVNGVPAARDPLAPFLAEAGFVPTSLGFHIRGAGVTGPVEALDDEEELVDA